MIYLILQESAINKDGNSKYRQKNVKGAETRLTLREGKETRRRVGFMPPCLRCHGEEGKRGGVWAPRRLVLDAAVKKGNKAACGLHAASSSMTRRRREMRRLHTASSSMPQKKRGNEAACGLHTASSSMPQKSGETRRHVGSTPPRLRCPRKERKRGSVWTPHRLVFNAAGRSENEAACGLHTASSSMPREG